MDFGSGSCVTGDFVAEHNFEFADSRGQFLYRSVRVILDVRCELRMDIRDSSSSRFGQLGLGLGLALFVQLFAKWPIECTMG